VRSSDTPRMIPSRGCLRAMSATLGAEYISETTDLSLVVASRLCFAPLWPKDDTSAIISW
jgi:hypothetical protein